MADDSTTTGLGALAAAPASTDKFMVVDAGTDDAVLWNGSANYSSKALKFSFENVARYTAADHGDVVEAFEARFDKIWAQARTKKQLAADDDIEVPACPMELSEL